MKLVLVANSAGGVGKTTTALAVAVAATEYGKKTLLIDGDSRASLTFACGLENPRVTTKEFLQNEFSLESAMVKASERFSLLPASTRLAALDYEKLISKSDFQAKVQDFDLVVVDSASAFTDLNNFFLSMADLVVIPSTTEILAIRGALHVKDFISQNNPETKPVLILTKAQGELDLEFLALIKADFEYLEPAVRRDDSVAASQSTGKSFLTTANQSGVAADYREITYSILEKLGII